MAFESINVVNKATSRSVCRSNWNIEIYRGTREFGTRLGHIISTTYTVAQLTQRDDLVDDYPHLALVLLFTVDIVKCPLGLVGYPFVQMRLGPLLVHII